MPKYLVNSAILKSENNTQACAEGAAKMLAKGKIKDVEVKACYCCRGENRVAFVIEGLGQERVLSVLQEQLNIPVASIWEVEEVTSA